MFPGSPSVISKAIVDPSMAKMKCVSNYIARNAFSRFNAKINIHFGECCFPKDESTADEVRRTDVNGGIFGKFDE